MTDELSKTGGAAITIVDSATSSSDLVWAAAAQDAPSGTAFLVREQTAGRGRRGAGWSSSRGGMYFSMLLRPAISPRLWFGLSFVAALAIRQELARCLATVPVMLKWPNDILLNNKKIGGILVESEVYDKKIRTIIGIGINIKIKKEESWWGDLSKFSIEAKRNELINQILSDFIEKSDKLDFNWMDEWKNSCIHMNKKIKINNGDAFEKEAIFLGVDKNGNAIVKTDQGKELISSGEISIKGIY